MNDISDVHYDWIDAIFLFIAGVSFLLTSVCEGFIVISIFVMVGFIFRL